MLHEIIIKGRQEGKTQKMLKDAVKQVSLGSRVAWVSITVNEARRVEQKFWQKYLLAYQAHKRNIQFELPTTLTFLSLGEVERARLFQAYNFASFVQPIVAAGQTWERVYFDNLDMMLSDLTCGAMFSVSMCPPEGEGDGSRVE